MAEVTAQVPDAGTPIFDAKGYVNPVWHEFFFTLLRRTGGTEGTDAGDVTIRVVILERRVTDTEKIEYSVADVRPIPPDQLPAEASTHGNQYDPDLHALASAAANGFMSAADKTKLDGMTAGAAVSAVNGTAPIVSSGGTTPSISISAATTLAAGSMSAADKAKIDLLGLSGSWTPTLTFTTPGDLNVVYGTRAGFWMRNGAVVTFNFVIVTTTFTFTTASGNLIVSGLPFSLANISQAPGKLDWQGITKASYTEISAVMLSGGSAIQFIASGSGQARSNIVNGNVVSGTQVTLSCSMSIPV